MITSTTIWGLKPDNSIIGGDTSPITLKEQVPKHFRYFEEKECIIGCIIQHSECGCLEFEPTYWWWGDLSRKEEFLSKLHTYWDEHADEFK